MTNICRHIWQGVEALSRQQTENRRAILIANNHQQSQPDKALH